MDAQVSYIAIDDETFAITICKPQIKTYVVDQTHPNYDTIISLLKSKRYDELREIIDPAAAIKKYLHESEQFRNITVDREQGVIRYKGVELHDAIVRHIKKMQEQGFDVNPMYRFLDNLLDNPSSRAVSELYSFLQNGEMPITEDGHFLAYKRVTREYRSPYDGITLHKPAQLMSEEERASLPFEHNGVTTEIVDGMTVVSMARNRVDDNCDNVCSVGLHFCSYHYLNQYFGGERVIVVKINPRDVVSIPVDYQHSKGRACRYVVLGEVNEDAREQLKNDNVFVTAVCSPEVIDSIIDKQEDESMVPSRKQQADAYIQGYRTGYKDGRDRTLPQYQLTFDANTLATLTPEHAGYAAGYADGRGHKRNLYKQ